jgi:PKD repeat protein
MFPTLRSAALLTVTGAALLVACRKDDPTGLDGPVPNADFTVALNTSQYPVVATFTNTSTDGFLYQWDFGDGSPLVSGQNVTHTYRAAGTFKAKLIAAGRGGTGTSPTRDVVVPSICGNAAFAVLTACGGSGSTSWTFDSQAGAITRQTAAGVLISQSAAPLPACQSDDQFSFTSTFAYSYDGGAGTYAGGACSAAQSGNSDFTYVPNGNLGCIVLLRNKAFIGTPDSVRNKTYDIIEATPTRLKLQGILPNGDKLIVTYMPQLSVLDRTKLLLTGGSSRTWVLDNAAQAVITVGPNDANPTGYYPGGSPNSLPPCQADDEYTFTSANVLNYNAFAETFVAGTPGSCQAARTYSSPFVFGPASGTGIAQIELSRAGSFIGVTDAPDLVYRILSIDNQNMVLRAGRPTAAVVFTIKLRVK